jgi:hypothetical protein
MKTFVIILLVAFVATAVFAQAPEKLSYDLIVNNATGTLVANRQVGVQLSVLQGSASGSAVYVETQTPTTDVNGLARLQVGGGSVVSGTFATIDWSAGPYFLKAQIDITGGTSYTQTITNQLVSTAYALYAKNAGSGSLADNAVTTSKIANNAVTGAKIQLGSDAAGDMMVYNGTDYARLPVGSNGQVLQVTSGSPSWGAVSGGGGGGGFTHFIGEYFEGGVIFHLWKDSLGAEHGLTVNTKDLGPSTETVFTPVAFQNTAIGASARSVTNGSGNTDAIIAQSSQSAAKYCRDVTDGGKTDWYLPAIAELQTLLLRKFDVNTKLSTMAGADLFLPFNNYWSSTEIVANAVYAMDDLSTGPYGKASTLRVRAVRRF